MFNVTVFAGSELASYHFGEDHPFGPDRHQAFLNGLESSQLTEQLHFEHPVQCSEYDLLLFHTPEYIEQVQRLSKSGEGYLDQGDTPAMKGIFEAASYVVGSTLKATEMLVNNKTRRAFVPIAGLHHSRRDRAAGFCVFNDCGVVIDSLRKQYGIKRIAYIDIDAHHGDGVFYSFEDDPDLCIVDFHEDGHFLYPGTGFGNETGKGIAKGTKLNISLPVGTGDQVFQKLWPTAEALIRKQKPEFILLQCGADSIAGDPITDLLLSEQTFSMVAKNLCQIADEYADSNILAVGGGGYNLDNIANGWSAVVKTMLNSN